MKIALCYLVVAVAILAIFAAIALPYLVRPQAANPPDFGAAAVQALHTIAEAQTGFHLANGRYAGSLDELVAECLPGFWSGGVAGYCITLSGNDKDWSANANPLPADGLRHFYVDRTGVVQACP